MDSLFFPYAVYADLAVGYIAGMLISQSRVMRAREEAEFYKSAAIKSEAARIEAEDSNRVLTHENEILRNKLALEKFKSVPFEINTFLEEMGI